MHSDANIFDRIRGKALLAPMLATTDIPFRTLCREYGAAMTFTEMVSANGILNSKSESFRNATFTDAERPVAIQLVAARPDDAAMAVRELLSTQPDAFDLNCGCPNDRICEAGAGANLLDDLSRLGAIVEATVRASPIPVSVKVRMKGNSRTSTIKDITRAVEQSGAACIIIHTRTKNTPYQIPATWHVLTEAVASVNIPVVGNGDVFSAADALRMMNETGCAAVMVARGSLGSPWIFRDISESRPVSVLDEAPQGLALHALIARHLGMIVQEFGEFRALPRMRKHALWYARFFEGWEDLRHMIFATDDAQAVRESVAAFFGTGPARLDTQSLEYRRIETAFRERVLFWTTDAVQATG